MFSFRSDSDDVAVATAPLPAQTVKQKFQPVAGFSAAVAEPMSGACQPAPVFAPAPAPPAPQVAAPQPNIRSTVFTSDGRPDSPWSKSAARVSPKSEPLARPRLGTPTDLPETDDGIEGVRKLLFGRQMGEVQTRVAELQLSLNGEMKRLREALMSRVDEMSGYLHRDMVVLRDEMQREMSQLKTDLFTAATALSSVKDRLMMVETQTHDATVAAFADIEGRLARQESAFATALDNIETKLCTTLDSKCAEALAVLARKSDVAEIFTQMGTLVAQESPCVELGWPSAASSAPAIHAAPPKPAMPERKALMAVGDSWAALAKGEPADRAAGDWVTPINPFMDDGNPIT